MCFHVTIILLLESCQDGGYPRGGGVTVSGASQRFWGTGVALLLHLGTGALGFSAHGSSLGFLHLRIQLILEQYRG